MLYRHSEVFRSLLIVADLTLVGAAWVAAYFLRFHTGIPSPLGIPGLDTYLPPLLAIVPLWFVLFRARGLYEPQRGSSLLVEAARIIRATAVGIVLLLAFSFFVRDQSYSRGVVALFSGLSAASVITLRSCVRTALRSARRRGYNLRYALVLGGPELAAEVIDRLHAHPEAGIRVSGVLSEAATRRSGVRGVPVLGGYAGLKDALRGGDRIDQVIIALPRGESEQLDKLLRDLEDEMVSVKIVPDLMHVVTINSSVEDLSGLPMISLRESPLVGWAAVQKRGFDLLVAGTALVAFAPVMAAAAAAVWMSSGRPLLYSQLRMGLDGTVFRIWKFRSMVHDAEAETGPVWATSDDSRTTRVGAFLRRTSLDELPQLWNVLRGDMSLVGPRPERLALIEEFRREIPGYMLRHKVKAGLTGWAQIHGLRGNTSLHERIEHDIYYIQNWSFELDIRILLLTLARGFVHRNAY